MSNTMHTKVKNFFSFIADAYLGYFSPTSGDDNISSYIRHFGDEKSDFKQFQFGYLAVACNNERVRPKIEILRELYKNPEETTKVLGNIKTISSTLRTYLDRIDSIPEEEMKEFITKFSRYVYLFTMMYFNKSQEQISSS